MAHSNRTCIQGFNMQSISKTAKTRTTQNHRIDMHQGEEDMVGASSSPSFSTTYFGSSESSVGHPSSGASSSPSCLATHSGSSAGHSSSGSGKEVRLIGDEGSEVEHRRR
uniref:Uncharacterized protein n=1 Tax=Arundo donax TaxID=35708 RepID=A0A0A9BR76_ARUDO